VRISYNLAQFLPVDLQTEISDIAAIGEPRNWRLVQEIVFGVNPSQPGRQFSRKFRFARLRKTFDYDEAIFPFDATSF